MSSGAIFVGSFFPRSIIVGPLRKPRMPAWFLQPLHRNLTSSLSGRHAPSLRLKPGEPSSDIANEPFSDRPTVKSLADIAADCRLDAQVDDHARRDVEQIV